MFGIADCWAIVIAVIVFPGTHRGRATFGAMAITIFDMEPIRLSYLNRTLQMDEAQARRNAPLSQAYRYPAPLSLIVAKDESDEFHRQSQEMRAGDAGIKAGQAVPKHGLDR